MLLQYQQLAEPVYVPASAETITLDKWERMPAAKVRHAARNSATGYSSSVPVFDLFGEGSQGVATEWRSPPMPTRRSVSRLRQLRHLGMYVINLDPLGSPPPPDVDADIASGIQPRQPDKYRGKASRVATWVFDQAPLILPIPEVTAFASMMGSNDSPPRRKQPTAQGGQAGIPIIPPSASIPEISHVSDEMLRTAKNKPRRPFAGGPESPITAPDVHSPSPSERKAKRKIPGVIQQNPVPEITPDMRLEEFQRPARKRPIKPAGGQVLDFPPSEKSAPWMELPGVRTGRKPRRPGDSSLPLTLDSQSSLPINLPAGEQIPRPARKRRTGGGFILPIGDAVAIILLADCPQRPITKQRPPVGPRGLLSLVEVPAPNVPVSIELPPINRKRLHNPGNVARDVYPIPEVESVPQYWHVQPQSTRRKLAKALRIGQGVAGNLAVGVPAGQSALWAYLDAAQLFVPGSDEMQLAREP